MKSDEGINLEVLVQLSKLKIMIPVSLTGFMGYFLYHPVMNWNIILVTAGILLMGVAASVLNQVQETDTDSKMERTRNRPLPSGRVKRVQALILFILTLAAGAVLIFKGGNFTAMLVSLFTITWYNGIYTPLKKITAYAVIPGALTGALPPLIGWIAAGGNFFDIRIILVQILFFAGQMPHFWLLVLRYGREYENAGLPSLSAIMRPQQISWLILAMVACFSIIGVLMRLYGVVTNIFVFVSILAFSIVLFRYFYRLTTGTQNDATLARYSALLNIYFILVMVLLITDRVFEKL